MCRSASTLAVPALTGLPLLVHDRHRGCGHGRAGAGVHADELLDLLARVLVRVLYRRRLHEVRGRELERAREPVVERQLREAHGVDDDAGRVEGVPDLELELDIERDVAERATL